MKVFIGKSSDFVNGTLLRPVHLSRDIDAEKKRLAKMYEQLLSLPAQIDKSEANLRRMEEELTPFLPKKP